MSDFDSPRSLVAERAVRLLRRAERPLGSRELALDLLRLEVSDDRDARQVLETAFSDDPRLAWTPDGWVLHAGASPSAGPVEAATTGAATTDVETDDDTTDRAYLILVGGNVPGEGFVLQRFSVIRMRAETVLAACGGHTEDDAEPLRQAARRALDGAVPICHDPPGALSTFERWLDAPIVAPISLRRLAHDRRDLPARHDWADLVAELGLHWRETEDDLELAESYAAALQALIRPDEGLRDLQAALSPRPPVPWERLEFTPADLDAIPEVPGVYRFFDRDGELLYVGKSRQLGRRVRSYFRDTTRPSPRVADWIERVFRFEIETSGSELEALLREARQIRKDAPKENVQRDIHASPARAERMRSILILEPAEGTLVLRAYLIREGRWIGSVGIGPRGGGLRLVQRLLDQYFFDSGAEGPRPCAGDEIDVELVARWLASHRHRVVAFDPTDLQTSREVIERLQWFVEHGGLVDPDGPMIPR